MTAFTQKRVLFQKIQQRLNDVNHHHGKGILVDRSDLESLLLIATIAEDLAEMCYGEKGTARSLQSHKVLRELEKYDELPTGKE